MDHWVTRHARLPQDRQHHHGPIQLTRGQSYEGLYDRNLRL